MVNCMVVAIPADLLVMLLSITTSSLGVVVLTSQKLAIALLLYIIGGYITGGLLAILTFFRRIQTPIFLIVQLMAYIFQIVTGIVFCVNIIHRHFEFSVGFRGWEVAIPVIFIVDVFFMAISITLLFMIFLQGSPKDMEHPDLEKDAVSLTYWLSDTPIDRVYPNKEDNPSQHLTTKQDPLISKKVSDQTLFDVPLYDTVVRSKVNNIDDESDLAYIMNYPSNNQIGDSDYLYYTNNNWMDSNTNVQSMKLSTDHATVSGPNTPTKKSSFGLFKNTRLNESTSKFSNEKSKRIQDLKQSKSVPNFLKTNNIDRNDNIANLNSKFTHIPNLNFSDIQKLNHSCPQPMHPINYEYGQNNINNESDINKYRRVSLIGSNCNDMSIPEKCESITNLYNSVKRSKSTGYISGNKFKKLNWEQRRKSIHDEKIFLQNVNESLLPAVLRSGESPIMGLKRRQQEILDNKAEEQNQILLSQEDTAKHFKSPRETTSDLSPVGEADLSQVKAPNIDQIEPDHGNLDYLNLPFISEFGEPIDQNKFKDFDQDTVVVGEEYPEFFKKTPRRKGAHKFNEVKYEKQSLTQSGQHSVEESEQLPDEYFKSLHGLEKIPKSSSYSRIVWNQEANGNKAPMLMNHISLKDWDANSAKWKEYRARSGANLNIPGITRLVSDHNLKSMSNGSNSTAPPDIDEAYLLPPLKTRLDNIDNLSDLHSTTGSTKYKEKNNSFVSLNISLSAPSLHTYRDAHPRIDNDGSRSVKQIDSNELNGSSIKSLENTLRHVNTPPERQINSTSSSSPIKKFFQESPKRLNGIFKRKPMNTRYSLDLSSLKDPYINSSHKHTSSAISNQFSMYSGKSSKSNSPRKSLRALLRSPSKQQTPSTAAPSFAETSKVKQTNLFNTDDDGCLLYIADNALGFWDLDTAQSSDRSRVSSVPSAVIGEYDREKWRTLKALQNQEKVTSEKVEV